MTAVLYDLLGYEIHRYPITKADWPGVVRGHWPPVLQWGDRTLVRSKHCLGWKRGDPVPAAGIDNRIYNQVQVVVIQDTPAGCRIPPL